MPGMGEPLACVPMYALEVTKAPRNLAVDSYRGLVMLLMMAEILQLSRVARALPGNAFWSFLAYHQTHVEWAGCSLHDTIQPGFSFLVGVAIPYSIASRLARGGTFRSLFLHALWRSLLLVALGVFLRSISAPQTYFTFEGTLSQIGLGYPILFLLAFRPPKVQWAAFGAILFAYWLAWALYPAHEPGYFSGFLAHWNKGDNFGNAFDQWFLNLFPRTAPYVANSGGYLTLSFIPTLGTMLLGLAQGVGCANPLPPSRCAACSPPARSGSPADSPSTSPASARWSSAFGPPRGLCSAAACVSFSWPPSAGSSK